VHFPSIVFRDNLRFFIRRGWVLERADFAGLDAGAITDALGAAAPGFSVVLLAECASTNSVLLAETPPDDGRIHVLVAAHQTAGRGRRGRTWQAWPGHGLTFSALWRFAPGSAVPAGLSLVAGLALARVLEELGVEGVQLKWPNDVLVLGRKVAGILVELIPGRGRTPAAVVGVGLNLCLPEGVDIPHPGGVTDLAACLGAAPDPNRVLALTLLELQRLFDIYAATGFVALRGAWQQRNAHAGLPVRILGEAQEIEGVCAGVDEDGALLLATAQGQRRVLSGDVSLRAG
jgi:BirA family biotin operon repressor/biotin-[acetyl-CoA-carboxylase] ligase